jgi:hypothetical protein
MYQKRKGNRRDTDCEINPSASLLRLGLLKFNEVYLNWLLHENAWTPVNIVEEWYVVRPDQHCVLLLARCPLGSDRVKPCYDEIESVHRILVTRFRSLSPNGANPYRAP